MGYQHWWLLPSRYSGGTGTGVGESHFDGVDHSLDSKGSRSRSIDGLLPANFTSKMYKSTHSFSPARTVLDRPLSTNVAAVITQPPSCSINTPSGATEEGKRRVVPTISKIAPIQMQPTAVPHRRPVREFPPLPICSWLIGGGLRDLWGVGVPVGVG